MPPAARICDTHICPHVTGSIPHVGGPVMMGASTVMIGMLPAARAGDLALCVGPLDSIAMGSMTVKICGAPAARIGDMTSHGGTVVMGFPSVMIGG
ncbi:MAG TPA: PAAR domain-containing protein [Planctomycetaceae bacterium]